MTCKKCNSENLLKAAYCHSCGNPFTEQEREDARKKSLVGVLETADKAKEKADKISDILSMKFITDNIFVRLALIVLPFVFTMLLSSGGRDMRIVDSDEYKAYYNTTTQEYFVDTDYGTVNLVLYVPKDTSFVKTVFTTSNSTSHTGNYDISTGISIPARSGGYYTLTAMTADGTELQSIVVYTV